MKEYIRLLRCKHYIKNLLIFFPLVFGGRLFDSQTTIETSIGFISFCLLSSVIYIINDIFDVEKDRKHPTKCERPLAKKTISIQTAGVILCFLFIVSILCLKIGCAAKGIVFVAIYFVLNLSYSIFLKHIPVFDVFALAICYILRIQFGGAISGVFISYWLYLTVFTAALFMGFGKRRKEFTKGTNGETRVVLKQYEEKFLFGGEYVFLSLTIAFYSLWTIIGGVNESLFWTIPLTTLIILQYMLDVEKDEDGDPVEVVSHDRIIIIMGAVWILFVVYILYML